MEKTSLKIDWGLFAIALFLGFFGLDKFYYAKNFKPAWKYALVKFMFNLIFLGIIWDIWDDVMIVLKQYQFDAREYFA